MPLYSVHDTASTDQVYVFPEDVANNGTATADRVFNLPSAISSPRGIVIDGSNLYIVDDVDDEVYVISANTANNTTATILRQFSLPSELALPQGMTIDGNDLYIVDNSGDEIFIIPANTANGSTATTTRRFNMPSGFTTPVSMVIDGNDLYVADTAGDEVFVVPANTANDGTATATRRFNLPSGLTSPNGLTIDGNDLYVAEVDGADIFVVPANTANNGTASTTRQFNLPTGLTNPNGLTFQSPQANLTITTTETNLYTGKTFDIDITADADISDFVVGDVTVTGGTANFLTETDAQNFVLNVTAGAVGTMNVAIAEDVVTPGNVAVDEDFTIVARATVGIAFDDSTLETGGSTTARIVFNGAVTDLTIADFSVNVGSVTNLQSTAANAYTATVTAPSSGSGTLTLTLRENAVDQGNLVETESLTYAPPTSTATITTTDTFIVAGEQVDFEIAFSRSVTGLTLGDFTITGATGNSVSGSGDSWTLRATAASGAGQISITLRANAVSPSNAAVTATFTRNAALSLGWTVPTTEVGETFSVTLTSNHPLTSVAISDFRLRQVNGTFITLNSSNTTLTNVSGTNNWRLQITITDAVDADFQMRLNANSVNFGGGSAPSANLNSSAFRIDTTTVSFTISVSDAAIYEDETFTATLQASETVTGFATGDVTVTGATKGAFDAVDGDTYTLELTANAGAGDIVISIAENVVNEDNLAASETFSRLARPTATISVSPTTLTENDSAVLTIQFSETVSNFAGGDITVTGATKGTFTAVDGDTYRQAITVNAGSGTVSVSLAAGVTSPPNAAVSESFTYIADTIPGAPTGFAVIVGTTTADASWTIGSDGGSPLTATQVTSDGGATWINISATATSHHFPNLTPETEYDFAARHINAVGTGTPTATLTFETMAIPPATVNITGPSSTRVGVSFNVNVAFDRAVTNLTLSDFTITPATATLNTLTPGTGNTYVLNVTAPATGTGDILITLPANSIDNGNTAGSITIAYAPASAFSITQVGPVVITVGATDYDLEVPISGTTANTSIIDAGDWEGFYMDWDQPNGILHIRSEEVTRIVGEYVWLLTVSEGSDSITGEIVYSVVPEAPVITPITETVPLFRGTRMNVPVEIMNNADTASIEGLQVGMKHEAIDTGLNASGILPADARLTETTFMAKAIAENATARVESMVPFEVMDEPNMFLAAVKRNINSDVILRVDENTANGQMAPAFRFDAPPYVASTVLITGMYIDGDILFATRFDDTNSANPSELISPNKNTAQNAEGSGAIFDLSSIISQPRGITEKVSGARGDCYILDGSNRRIHVIDIGRTTVSSEGYGVLPSNLTKPRGIHIDANSDCYIVDLTTRRVSVTDELNIPINGGSIPIDRYFVLPTGCNAPGDIFVDANNAYVVDFADRNEDFTADPSETANLQVQIFVMDKNTANGATATATRTFNISTDYIYSQAIFIDA